MNLLTDSAKSLYFRYLFPSFGAAMVMSIYMLVDAIVIGKGVGYLGVAALSIVLPILCLPISLGLLFGVGGSVLMSYERGKGDNEMARNYFTVSLLGISAVTVILWLLYGFQCESILRLVGATGAIMPYAMEYMKWIIVFFPAASFSYFLSVFVRNDKDPNRAMAGVIIGGIANCILDYVFVFPAGWGMGGAALASVTGMSIQVIVCCSHFLLKNNELKWIKPKMLAGSLGKIGETGAATFLNELSNGLIVLLFNIQILRYAGETAVSVYGVVANCAILFSSLFCGVGQAVQPLVSVNMGAKQTGRIFTFRNYGIVTAALLSVIFGGFGILFPEATLGIFLKVKPELLEIAQTAIPLYFTAFLFMGINLFSTYFYQSILEPKGSLALSLLRSVFLSCALVFILPLVLGLEGIWMVMPCSEFLTFCVALYLMRKYSRKLKEGEISAE